MEKAKQRLLDKLGKKGFDTERMSRGITLTEEQAMKMTKALVDRFRA